MKSLVLFWSAEMMEDVPTTDVGPSLFCFHRSVVTISS